MNNSEINDIRTPAQLKGFSFSKYKKTDVRNQLIESMKNNKVEPACYWSAELICGGHYMELWETIMYFVGKHIHLGNPKIVIYLDKRFQIFRNIMSQGHYVNELQLRNNPNIRKLFAEILCILTISNKKNSIEPVKINRLEEFDIGQMTERLKAPSTKYTETIFKPKDPPEFMIAMNEFAYAISSEQKNMANACYWIEWVIDFDAICKKKKEPCYCEKRNEYDVDNPMKKEVIWMVWDTLLYYSNMNENKYNDTVLRCLLNLFCVRYTSATPKKRRYLLYFAISLLTESVPTNIEMISDKTILNTVVEQIDNIYIQIKKNEESPNTDYLFNNLETKSNFEKSIQKMEMMNQLMDS